MTKVNSISADHLLFFCAVPDGAGAMRMVYAYALHMVDRGYRITLVHGDTTANSTPLPASAVRILTHIASKGIEIVPLKGFRKRYDAKLESSLCDLVLNERISALVGFHPLDIKYALRVAGKCNRVCVVSMQNRQVFWGNRLVRKIKKLVFDHLMRRHATRVVCTSKTILDDVLGSGVPQARCCVIPNGINTAQFLQLNPLRKSEIRQQFGLSPADKLIVNVGRLDVQKGQDILLQALKSVCSESWKLILVGGMSEGRKDRKAIEYCDGLRELVAQNEWQKRVIFVGWRDDVSELLNAADVYVHASRWEGPAAPLAVVEAMAAAKPVIASNCCGRPEGFVDGEHGYIFESESAVCLAEVLNKVLHVGLPELSEMGKRCRELAQLEFDIASLSQRFEEQIVSALQRAKLEPCQ